MRFPCRLLFACKLILFLALLLGSGHAFAQVPDSTYQKPELNQGTVPEEPATVIVTPPAPPQKIKEKPKTKPVISEEPVYKNRFFTGGSGSLSLGTYSFVQIAPILGYQITEKFAVGSGLSYIYYNNPDDEDHIFGGKIFMQAMVYKTFFVHAEYELLDFRNNFPALLAGGGYRSMFSEKAGADMMILLDLNQNARSYYTNPIFRAGFILYLN